jgi:hypothetical protein
MQVLIDIPEAKRPGITAARLARNASLPAQVQDGVDAEGNPVMVANPALLATDESYVTWVLGAAVDSYNTMVAPPPPPPPPPGVVNGVPQEVTRRQARTALHQTGRLVLVQSCIDAIKVANQAQGDLVQIEWDDSQTFQRQRPSLIALATNPAPYGLAMTLEELDQLFILAATL